VRAYLISLTPKDREFVVAHATYEVEAQEPCDRDFAERLGVTRQTILNRRRRLRSRGVPLYPFRNRGYQARSNPLQGELFPNLN
jgi:biotin operon repressor